MHPYLNIICIGAVEHDRLRCVDAVTYGLGRFRFG